MNTLIPPTSYLLPPTSYLIPPTSYIMLPLSYLNQLTYCPRRFWYMYVQGEIAINAPMLEGIYQHQTRADQPGQETDDQGRAIHRRVWVWSERLEIAGIADFIEHTPHTNQPIPVEYKHGQKGQWDNDQIQLCAQALCLEEMLNTTIPHGEIFYYRSRRRITVPFTPTLRQQTETAIQQARALLQTNQTPLPTSDPRKCKHCSLQPICLPHEVQQLNKV